MVSVRSARRISYRPGVSRSAKLLLGGITVLWVVGVALVVADPLGSIGVTVLSVVAVAAVVLVLVLDAAVRSARSLREHS